MKTIPKIAIIGSGSWATALAKIIHDKQIALHWYFRNQENIDQFQSLKHNPNYLTGLTFDTENITFSNNLAETIKKAEIIVLAVPSLYLKSTLALTNSDFKNKKIISAIKGIIPTENTIVGTYLNQKYDFPLSDFCVITGPSHAEEVAMKRLSYLTIAGENTKFANAVAELLSCEYVRTSTTDDIYGTEYAAILKNIMAIAVGICHSLRYGDNFQAVLVSNAIQEMKRFLNAVYANERDIKGSAYLGDLLVTAYSQFSRNRIFGTMIGKGYSAKAAVLEMNMAVEGFYALKWIKNIVDDKNLNAPIIEAVFQIIQNNKKPSKVIRKLTQKLS